MSAEVFEQINKTLLTVEQQQAILMKDIGNLAPDTKKALDEVTLLKNSFADLGAQMRALQKLQTHLGHERRMAWGDPIHSISRDHDKAALVMAGLARHLDILNHCNKTVQGVAKDLDGGNAPGSGYIANAEIDREIYDLLLTYGAYRQLNVRTVGTRTTDLRLKTARTAMSFVDEAATIGADSTKAGSKANLALKKIGGLISVSNELAEDDITGVLEDIMRDFAESAAYVLDWISFTANGDADSTDGGYNGMFYAGTSRVAASGNISVETLDFEDVLACIINAPAEVLQRSPKWFLHPSMLARLMTIKDTTGRPIFQTALEAPNYGSMGTILGFPVAPVGVAPNVNGTSKKIAAFGDPQGQAVRIRRDLMVDRSKDWAFDTDELTFRGTLRGGSVTRLSTAFQILTTAAS